MAREMLRLMVLSYRFSAWGCTFAFDWNVLMIARFFGDIDGEVSLTFPKGATSATAASLMEKSEGDPLQLVDSDSVTASVGRYSLNAVEVMLPHQQHQEAAQKRAARFPGDRKSRTMQHPTVCHTGRFGLRSGLLHTMRVLICPFSQPPVAFGMTCNDAQRRLPLFCKHLTPCLNHRLLSLPFSSA